MNQQCREVKSLINQTGTKVNIYFGVREVGDDFDPESQNFTYTNLNPKCIKAWIYQISAEKLVWKQYGLDQTGAIELLCDSKYKKWFQTCNKIEINNEEYSVFKSAVGNRVLIYDRPNRMVRVVLQKKG